MAMVFTFRNLPVRCSANAVVHACSHRSLSFRTPPSGARPPNNPLASAQVVDPRYVNAHQCTLDQDSSTQKILHRIKRSLALLEQGQYSKAHRTINPEGLSSVELSASAPRNIAWAAANTAGVVMFHAGEFSTADKLLRKALKHCEELTSNGLAQDAYCDLAACLSDVAVNVLKWKGQSEEAANLLKRALYMTERAYRPNYHLIESLRSNLAAAYLETDPEQARTVVEKSVKTRDAVQTTLSGGAAAMTDREKCGHARSLSVWAAVLARTGQHAAAVEQAEKARSQLEQASGLHSVDTGRATMLLAYLNWVRAEQSVSKRHEEGNRKRALEQYVAAADAMKKGGLKSTHPDRIAADVSILVLEQALYGKTSDVVRERRKRCLSALRRWEQRTGGEEGALMERVRGVLDGLKRGASDAEGGGEQVTVAPLSVPLVRCGLGLLDVMRDSAARKRDPPAQQL